MSKNENIVIGTTKWSTITANSTIAKECWCNHWYDQHGLTLHGEALGCNKCDCPAYDTDYMYLKVRTAGAID